MTAESAKSYAGTPPGWSLSPMKESAAAAAAAAAAPRLTWTWTPFEAMTGHEVYEMLALRSRVFVVEQACAFLDADDCDQAAWHLRGHDADGVLAACLRGLDAGVKYPEPSIGRVVVAPSARGRGLGSVLMEEGIRRGRARWPGTAIVIGAQHRLAGFYAALGFIGEGELYLEDGIDHIRMRLPA